MKKSTFSITIPPATAGKSIEHALKEDWGFSKKLIHQWRMEKAIDLNGELTPWKSILSPGDIVTIRHSEDSATYPSAEIDVEILYEDDHLLIVNKPSGIDTHPNSPDDHKTLVNGVVSYLQSNGHSGYSQPVHRLDRDTTGAILFAKHSAIKPILDRLLEQRAIKRIYWALVEGYVTKSSGTIQEPIGNDRHHSTRKRVSPSGQNAVTHYKRLGIKKEEQLTWLELRLDTGRTHQIRVHLSHIGYPLAGDTLYGGKKSTRFPVQALHAVELSFIHPFIGESVSAKAPDRQQPPRFNGN